MTGVTHKALRALLTDPHSGQRFAGAAIARGAVAMGFAIGGLFAILILSLGLGQ